MLLIQPCGCLTACLFHIVACSFAYTNNLAASYTVAVASAILLSIYASKAKSDLQLTGQRPPSPSNES